MAVLSRLVAARSVLKTTVRFGGDVSVVANRPSRWNYDLFKDSVHFYFMLGAIPLGLLVTFANIFKGPAALQPIPEGYVPKEHEYFKSPITRFLVKHVYPSFQQTYEYHLGCQWNETKQMNMFNLQKEIKRQMKLNQDYKGWYTRPVSAEYLRMSMNTQKDDIAARGIRER